MLSATLLSYDSKVLNQLSVPGLYKDPYQPILVHWACRLSQWQHPGLGSVLFNKAPWLWTLGSWANAAWQVDARR